MSTSAKCCKRIYSGTVAGYLCRKPAKVEFEGRHYCTIHSPERIAKRKVDRNARIDALLAENNRLYQLEKERSRRADCFDELVAALDAWKNFTGCCLHGSVFQSPAFIEASHLTRAALAKARGGT